MHAYDNFQECYNDYLSLINLCLEEYLAYNKIYADTESVLDKYKGIAVSYEQVSKGKGRLPFLLSASAEEQIQSGLELIEKKAESSDIFIPLMYISDCFSLDRKDRMLIMTAYFASANRNLSACIAYLNDDVNKRFLTLTLAAELFFHGDMTQLMFRMERKYKYIFDRNKKEHVFYGTELCINNRIYELLAGDFIIKETKYTRSFSLLDKMGEVFGRKKEISDLSRILRENTACDICLIGEKGIGRKFTAAAACRISGKNMVAVDFTKFAESDYGNASDDIVRELYIQKAVCCIELNQIPEETGILSDFMEKVRKVSPCIVYCMEKQTDIGGDAPCIRFWLKRDNYLCSTEMWKSGTLPLAEDVDINELALKYKFTPKTIAGILKTCETQCRIQGKAELSAEQIEKSVLELSGDILSDKAVRLNTKFTLDDLILPQREKDQIVQGMNHIRYKYEVYDVWNFKSGLAYGRGLSMLFEGPPGTGKTMAASIIGNTLGLPVFKIDLSKVVSKYVGETEKSLGEVFDIADKNNAVLFFDETDALFGKRSEIKDSHDKYANIETSYLLQKMEEYDGIVVMTTNFLQNIDEAFLRRISYIIHFPFPESKERLLLWKKAFPAEADLSMDIDLNFLADHYEMSGAMIKSAAVSAAFLAASKHKQISMREILIAVKQQFSKFGKNFGRNDMGPYYIYFEDM